jgi:hypothetical protein
MIAENAVATCRQPSLPMKPDLDRWLADPTLRVVHRRESSASPEQLWGAACAVRLSDTARLGRLVRWRIPGTTPDISFDELFRSPPFIVLDGDQAGALVSGLVGRIWTLRRDYPQLSEPEQFQDWSTSGTVKVLLSNWIEPAEGARTALVSESRVLALGIQGRIGLGLVRPLIAAFGDLIGSDGIGAAVALAEDGA